MVNSDKSMDNCWISYQSMADIKKIYDDLIIINLYKTLSVFLRIFQKSAFFMTWPLFLDTCAEIFQTFSLFFFNLISHQHFILRLTDLFLCQKHCRFRMQENSLERNPSKTIPTSICIWIGIYENNVLKYVPEKI